MSDGRATGTLFRAAVAREFYHREGVELQLEGTWLTVNGQRIAIRYSQAYRRSHGTHWWYGVSTRDQEELTRGGALILIMPQPDEHRFAYFSEASCRQLLAKCTAVSRGDIKIHVDYFQADGVHQLQEWPEFVLDECVSAFSPSSLLDAGVDDQMGLEEDFESQALDETTPVLAPVNATVRIGKVAMMRRIGAKLTNDWWSWDGTMADGSIVFIGWEDDVVASDRGEMLECKLYRYRESGS